MNLDNQQRQMANERGLILLVVLSMLTLFSLLAISYVIFSGQSRSANFGIARRDFHGMRPGEVIDVAMKQALRGTVDNISAVGPHSLLADLYGHAESMGNPTTPGVSYLLFQARVLPATTPPEIPEVLAGRFLRIPLYEGNDIAPMRGGSVVQSFIPNEDDALTGRVLSFLEGPLEGESFRIVRSIGSNPPAPFAALRRSVVIDLDDAGAKTSGISAAYACVRSYGAGVGYQMWINARELNGLGYGVPYNFDGQSVSSHETNTASRIAMNLQPGMNPNSSYIPPPPAQPGLEGQIAAANARAFSVGTTYASDSDESYDAPDVNDFYLAHTRSPLNVPDASSDGLPGQDIIPSFHRAALINYIINREDLSDTSIFTQDRFLSLLDDIQGACARPLAITVINLEGHLPYVSANPFFDSNNIALSTAVLNLDLGGSWSNWGSGSPSPRDKFLDWARMLTGGPWDVDTNGDGINDSVWVDLDLPLITSPEGKLLKMMAAYYIEDLDSRLDLNAVGNLSQQISTEYNASTGSNSNYAQPGTDLPQGFGVGPAESSLRHLFGSDVDWKAFLDSRYGGIDWMPGSGTFAVHNDDLRSQLNGGAPVFIPSDGALRNTGTRSKRQDVFHNQLPGLPTAVRGDYALGFDRLGNPLTLRGSFTTPLTRGPMIPMNLASPRHHTKTIRLRLANGSASTALTIGIAAHSHNGCGNLRRSPATLTP